MATYDISTQMETIFSNFLREGVGRFVAFDTNDNDIDSVNLSLGDFTNNVFELISSKDISIPDDTTVKGYYLEYDDGIDVFEAYTVTFDSPEYYEFGGTLRITNFKITFGVE